MSDRNPVKAAIGPERGALSRVAREMGIPRQNLSLYAKRGYMSRAKAKKFCEVTGAKLEDVIG